jgi:hypothetical protein
MKTRKQHTDQKGTMKQKQESASSPTRLPHDSHTSPTESHCAENKAKGEIPACSCSKNIEKRGIRPIESGRFNHRLPCNHLFNQIIRPAASAAPSVATRRKRQSPAMITIQLVMAKNIGLIKISEEEAPLPKTKR